MKRLKYTSRGFWKRLESFAEEGDSADSVRESVSRILEEVKARGDEALIELSERFDGFRSSARDLRIPEVVLKEAASSLTPLQKRSIREAIRCVESFHRKALPQNWTAPKSAWSRSWRAVVSNRAGGGLYSGRECSPCFHRGHDLAPRTFGWGLGDSGFHTGWP
jgi:histidinol dehydrogenase